MNEGFETLVQDLKKEAANVGINSPYSETILEYSRIVKKYADICGNKLYTSNDDFSMYTNLIYDTAMLGMLVGIDYADRAGLLEHIQNLLDIIEEIGGFQWHSDLEKIRAARKAVNKL